MRFFQRFPTRTLFAVVHVESFGQAYLNVMMAMGGGVQALFLINHRISDKELVDIFLRIRDKIANNKKAPWIGLNLLAAGLSEAPERAFDLLPRNAGVGGLWVDHMAIDAADPQYITAARVRDAHQSFMAKGNSDCLLFAPFAFKGQAPVKSSCNSRIAPHVFEFADVAVTSGPGTGRAAHPDKVQSIRDAIGNRPLVVASGVTPENIVDYPGANGFLTFTGIHREGTNDFDPRRIAAFLKALNG